MELKELIQKRWISSAKEYGAGTRKELKRQCDKWKQYITDNKIITPGMSILDTCCGPGFMSIVFSGDDHTTIGIDECDDMLEEAQLNARLEHANVNFEKMDCHNLAFSDSTFDLIVTRYSLWTLYNPGKALKEWIRVLKPEGRLLIFDCAWNAEYHDKSILEEKIKTRKEFGISVCEEYYGDRILAQELDARSILGRHKRPDWDFNILAKNKLDTDINSDIWKLLWDEEKKKAYAYIPMFMISAKKRRKK